MKKAVGRNKKSGKAVFFPPLCPYFYAILTIRIRQLLELREGALDHLRLDAVGDAHMSGGTETRAGHQQQIKLLGPLTERHVVRLQTAGEEIEGSAGLHHMVAHLA